MKNVLMIFIFLGSLTLQKANAQKGCTPCPPGCCIFSCCTSGKGSVAAAPAQQQDLIFTTFNTGGDHPGCNRMTKTEMKSCLVSCQGAPNDNAHTADAMMSAGQANAANASSTPACHPVCLGPTACKAGVSSSASSDSARSYRVKEKG